MAYTIIPRHGTLSEFSTLNRIYAEGELLLEEQLDGTYRIKIANGVQTYNLLPYVAGSGGGVPAEEEEFGTIVVPGQSDIVADTAASTLNIVGTNGIAITTNPTTDTITFSNTFGTIAGTVCQGNDSRIGTLPGIAIRATGGDDTAVFQAAVNSLSATGGIIYLWPELYRISGVVNVPYPIIFQGCGFQEGPSNPNSGVIARPSRGTWIWHDSTTNYAFTFSTMATGQNCGMRDLAFWEVHPTVDVGWAPTIRNFCIYVSDAADRIEFRNVHLHNVYKGIYADNVGRLILNHVTGQLFHTGIQQDEGYDMPRWQNIHFWPYWSSHTSVVNWTQANGVPFRVGRIDGLFADNIFCFGYFCLFHLYVPTVDGGASTKVYIGNVFGDFSARLLTIDQNGATLHFNQVTHQAVIWGGPTLPLSNSAGIVINSSDCTVSFNHLRVDQTSGPSVLVNNTNNVVWIDHADFRSWNLGAGTRAGAIHIADNTSVVHLNSEPKLAPAVAGDFLLATQPGLMLKPVAQNFISNPANEIRASSNSAGQPPLLSAIGTDTNIDFSLFPKGTGRVRFGTRVASADAAVTGYIEIKDSGGTLRRLAVIG